jgi:hypothetical protein
LRSASTIIVTKKQQYEIENNTKMIENAGIDHIKWLSYPYGAAKNVNTDTHRWMQENKDWFGIFAKGGVNTFFTRTEWLRTGIAQLSLAEFKNIL